VVGALLLPVLAAIGAIAALVTDCTIVVEKVEEQDGIPLRTALLAQRIS